MQSKCEGSQFTYAQYHKQVQWLQEMMLVATSCMDLAHIPQIKRLVAVYIEGDELKHLSVLFILYSAL